MEQDEKHRRVWPATEGSPSAGVEGDGECVLADQSADSIVPVQEQRQIFEEWRDLQDEPADEDQGLRLEAAEAQKHLLQAMEAKTQEIRAGRVLREQALREAELVQRESQIRERLLKLDEEVYRLSKQEDEMSTVQQALNSIGLEVREREHSAKHLSQQIDTLQSQVQMVEAKVRARHSVDNNRIKAELSAVLESRREVLAELKLVGAEQALLVNRRLMLVADIESRYREQAELVSQQEELERFVREFGAGDPCISVLQQQGHLEEQLRQLETEIDLVEQSRQQMSSANIKAVQKKVDSECRSLKSRISAGLKLRDEKMLRLKRELDLVLEGVGNAFRLEGLGDSIVGKLREVVGFIGRGIEVEMMREQVKSTLIEEESLRTSYHQRILSLRDLTSSLPVELRRNPTDHILQGFTEKFQNKIQGFIDWRTSLAKVLDNNEGSGDYKSIYKLFTDQKLERQLQKELSQMIDWNEEYAFKVEKLLNLLTEYSKVAGEKGKEFLQEKKNLELLEVQSFELEAQLQIDEMRGSALDTIHQNLMRKRVDITEELAEIRTILERDLTEQVETIFKHHEIQKVSEYKHLQRTYGSRCLERRVLEQKAEILHSVIQEKRNMLQRVSDQQQTLNANVSKATNMLQSVEQQLLPELRRLECNLQDVQQGQIDLQTRDRQLLNSEEELVQLIGELEALEEAEVKDELSKIEAVDVKLQTLIKAKASLDEEIRGFSLKKTTLEFQIKSFHQKTLEIESEKKGLQKSLVEVLRDRESAGDHTQQGIPDTNKRRSHLDLMCSPKLLPSPHTQEVSHTIPDTRQAVTPLIIHPVNLSKLEPQQGSDEVDDRCSLTVKTVRNSDSKGKVLYARPPIIQTDPALSVESSNIRTRPHKRSATAIGQDMATQQLPIHSSPTEEHYKSTPTLVTADGDSLQATRAGLWNWASNPFTEQFMSNPSQKWASGASQVASTKAAKSRNSYQEKYFLAQSRKPSTSAAQNGCMSSKSHDLKLMLQRGTPNAPEVANFCSGCGKTDRAESKSQRLMASYSTLMLHNLTADLEAPTGPREDLISQRAAASTQGGLNTSQPAAQNTGQFLDASKYYLPKPPLDREKLTAQRKDPKTQSFFNKRLNRRSDVFSSGRLSNSDTSSFLLENKGLLGKSRDSNKENVRPKGLQLNSSLHIDIKAGKKDQPEGLGGLSDASLLDRTFAALYNQNRQGVRALLERSGSSKTPEMRKTLNTSSGACLNLKPCLDPVECRKHGKYFRIDSANTSVEEMALFQLLRPLLEGTHIYKKFTSSTMRRDVFDPRRCLDKSPEQCGYGLRFMRLNLSKRCLEIQSVQKASVERAVCLSTIIKVSTAQWEQLKREGAAGVELIPFDIISRDGTLELISLGSAEFRTWIQGLQRVLAFSKDVLKVAQRVKCYCI